MMKKPFQQTARQVGVLAARLRKRGMMFWENKPGE